MSEPYGRGDARAIGDAAVAPMQIAPQTGRWRASAIGRRVPEALAVVVLALALAMLIGKGAGVAHYAATIVRYPFQIDDAEGVILAEAAMMARGANPYAYQPSPVGHFYAGPYTPLYTLVNAAVVWVAGPTFAGGRALQLLATLAVAAWIAWSIGRSVRGRLAWLVGVWAAVLFLSCHLVAHWAVMVRPDMTALAFNLVGATLLRRRWEMPGREPGWWRGEPWPRGWALGDLALGAGCFALGWLTKQSFVAVPLTCILCLLLVRPKMAATLAGFYAGMVGALLGILTLATGGGFFQKIYYYQGSWAWEAYTFLVRPFAQRYGLLPAVALIAALALCARQRRLTFAACWLALTALKTLTAGTDGGNHNHFVELLAASMLVAGQGVAALVASPRTGHARTSHRAIRFRLIGLGMVVLLTGAAVGEQEGNGSWLAWHYRLPGVAERDEFARARDRIAASAGPIYGDSVGLGLLALTGHAVRVTDPFTLAAEVRLGRWDDGAVVADIAAGRYQLIALRGDVAKMDPQHPPGDMTPGLIRAIRLRYHVVERGVVWLYAPIP